MLRDFNSVKFVDTSTPIVAYSTKYDIYSFNTAMNKDKAMQMLKARLYLLKQQENDQKSSDIRGDVKDINFGSQIRSYVLQPYTMVKDHRTNKDIGNAQSVLDGNINPFINAYLNWISTGKTEGNE